MILTTQLSDYLRLRHNGVIIEAAEAATEGDENSNSPSRSGTPLSSKNNENPNGVPVEAHQGVPTATGPSSYYRQHTALINRKLAFPLLKFLFLCPYPAYIPPRIQDKMQLVHPTSSSRTTPPWPGYPHWPSGVPPPHMNYINPPLCYPSPHYRPHTSGYPSPSPSDSSQQPNGAGPSTPLQANSTDLSRNSPCHSSQDSSSITCIDPELDSYAELTAEDVVAAMRVVMSMQVKSAEDAEDHERNQNGHDYMTASRCLDGDHMNDRDLEDRLNGLHDYSPSLERPEPMEHILTEDGEPMLNPGASRLGISLSQIF